MTSPMASMPITEINAYQQGHGGQSGKGQTGRGGAVLRREGPEPLFESLLHC